METHAMRKVEQTDVERREERERDADSAHNTVVLPTDLATSWTLVADALAIPTGWSVPKPSGRSMTSGPGRARCSGIGSAGARCR